MGSEHFRWHWSYTHGDAGSIPADPTSGCRLKARRPIWDGKTNGQCTRTARIFPPARAGAAFGRAHREPLFFARPLRSAPHAPALARLHLAVNQTTAMAARLGRALALEKRDGRDPVLYTGITGSIPAEGSIDRPLAETLQATLVRIQRPPHLWRLMPDGTGALLRKENTSRLLHSGDRKLSLSSAPVI